MEDSAKDVEKKIKAAYCVEKEIAENPVIDLCRYIILPAFNDEWTFSLRDGDTKKDVTYRSYAQLEADYVSGVIHPSDLKPAVTIAINKLI